MLGTPLVGDIEAIISYVKPNATIDYVLPIADIVLEYNSKNKQPYDAVTLDDTTGITVQVDYNKEYTDSVTLAEEILVAAQYNLEFTESLSTSDAFSWTTVQSITETIGTGDTPGIGQIYPVTPTDSVSVSDSVTFLHDGMLNTNMLNTRLISVGSREVSGDDVNITLT